jgi:hypothetical protein
VLKHGADDELMEFGQAGFELVLLAHFDEDRKEVGDETGDAE